MESYTLQNQHLTIIINKFGAELKSLKDNASGQEYLWDAKPEFWKRTSPVLFPLVGSLKDKRYRYKGKEYAMPQHGFARDMEFMLKEISDTSILFQLEDTEETFKIYPFHFRLEIGYAIEGRNVRVQWEVANTGDDTMYFSIGGHPAFCCPWADGKYSIQFDTEHLDRTSLKNGLATRATHPIELKQGILPIDEALFSKDALVIEHDQAHKVSLLRPDATPYLTVSFDAPLFGIWSPAGKKAPFVCIEPWYGRCDEEDFAGTIEEREWGNKLEAGTSFEKEYTISI